MRSASRQPPSSPSPFLSTNSSVDLAKISPHILSAEKFGLHLGTFFVSKYAHIAKAFITVTQLRWSRVRVEGDANPEGHSHAFYRDGEDKRVVKIEVRDHGALSSQAPKPLIVTVYP